MNGKPRPAWPLGLRWVAVTCGQKTGWHRVVMDIPGRRPDVRWRARSIRVRQRVSANKVTSKLLLQWVEALERKARRSGGSVSVISLAMMRRTPGRWPDSRLGIGRVVAPKFR